ncbi:unnamed protein product [Rhizoctonia solani]|uniref:Uncharacterized protein n=1 Tax=Rhizoctonia solani TaxID=456999 RepID=A0A8H3C537_9AGAM|nr:unnamed protein product [Rhizoctonia solani]
MLLFSHLIIAAGALLTSVRHSSRPDPGDFVHLFRQGHRSLSTTRLALPSARVERKGNFFLSVSQTTNSKNRFRWGKRSTRVNPPTRFGSGHHPSYSNTTWTDPTTLSELVVLTVKYYDGPKELAVYDDRRALAIYAPTPRDLAIYDRPKSVALYSEPSYHEWLRVDPNLYHIASKTCAPRLVNSTASEEHQKGFEGMNSVLRCILNSLAKHLTFDKVAHAIGQRDRAPIYALVLLVALFGVLFRVQEHKNLPQPTNYTVFFIPSDGSLLDVIHASGQLMPDQAELVLCEEDHWWTGGKKYTTRRDVFTIVLPHITSSSLPISTCYQSRPTSVRLINRRRGFLRALHDVERSKVEYDLD